MKRNSTACEMLAFAIAAVGVLFVVVGHYEGRVAALENNPVTRTRILPRTQYDDLMGVDWTSESRRV